MQRILIEKTLDLDLRAFIARAVAAGRSDIERLRSERTAPGRRLPRCGRPAAPSAATGTGPAAQAAAPAAPATADAVAAAEVYDFLMERLRAYYLEGAGAAAPPGAPP